jgi:ribosomal protein L24E
LAAGCGSGSKSSSNAANPPVPAKPAKSHPAMMSADTGARLQIQSPQPGTVVHGNDVPFDVGISNFKVDCRFAGKANRSGVGHYHVELDGALINMFCSDRSQVSLQNVKPGRHTLEFLAAEDNHTDDMKSMKKVSFTYRPAKALPAIGGEQKGAPSIRILSPKPGSTVHGGFDFTVQPKNFEFSCALYGKPDVAGYGHWHINVDSTKKGMMGMGTMLGMSCRHTFHVSLAGIKPGPHTFFAILEDNQHAPTPHKQASVKVNVR